MNGKKYVGVTTNSLTQRWREHKSCAQRGSLFVLHKAIRKYGLDNFTIEHIATSKELSDAFLSEKELIKQYNTRQPHGYNMTDGGDGQTGNGWKISEAGRLRMSIAHIGKCPPLWVRQLAIDKNKGAKRSIEACQRMARAKIGKTQSDATKEKRRKSLLIYHERKRLQQGNELCQI